MQSGPDRPPHEVLFGLMMGAWVSQTVGTFARLRMADALAAGDSTGAEVAARLGFDADATHRLLCACAGAGLLERKDEVRFALTPLGELLRSDVPGSMRALMDCETAPGHWLPWGKLDERVRSGASQVIPTLGCDPWTYYRLNPEEGNAFAEGMSGLSAGSVAAILAAYDFGDPKRVVDVGGSHGVFLGGVLGKYPEAHGVLFDLPNVVEEAGPTLERAGVRERVEIVAGDFFTSVPAGGDLYLLKHILHDWDDASCLKILRLCRDAMAPGGKVLVGEMLLGSFSDPPGPATFLDINMMVMLTGRERSAAEFAKLFAAAGLKLGQVFPTASPIFLLEAFAA